MGSEMKTRYEHIRFEKEGNIYHCQSNKSDAVLGCCYHYEPWHQWIFEFNYKGGFSVSCLRDIIHFIGQL